MKTIFAVTIALSLGTIPATSVTAQLPTTQATHASHKRQTSDPYFSSPAQTAAEQKTTWSVPQSTPPSDQREIWKSLGRKTSKPIQRLDFSQLQVKADLLKTASAWQAPKTENASAVAPDKKIENSTTIDFSAPATSMPAAKSQPRQQAKQTAPLKPVAVRSLVPLQVAKPIAQATASPSINKSRLLSPLPTATPAPHQPKQLAFTPEARPLKPVGNPIADFQSSVQQATYQQPIGPTYSGSGTRIADNYSHPNSSTVVTGESFEPSRVVAIVGGDPIFVGDMLFEINQLIEKHMKGAPEATKVQQRGNLIKRLLPKYVDQKMLFLSTTGGLPDGADIEDVISQAEKTFNKQALPVYRPV